VSVQLLIDELVGHGVELWLDDGRLRVRGPEEAVIPHLYAQLRACKAEVASVLAAGSGRVDQHPLSYSQQSLWLLHQLAPDASCYNVNAVIEAFELDLAVLQAAIDAIARAHPILRTVYRMEQGRPLQVVLDEGSVPIACSTVDPWTPQNIDDAVAAAIDTPFDLEQQVIRIDVLRAPVGERKLIVLTVHHIACDYWSLQALLAQIHSAYRGGSAAQPAEVVRPKNTYLDYMRWQRAALASAAAERHRAFWQDYLPADLPRLELATDRPRPPQQSFDGKTISLPLAADLRAGVQAACRQQRVTPFMYMLAVFQVLLGRYSGQQQFAIGLATSGRDSPETRNIIGNFVNMLVLRADLRDDPDFISLLAAVRAQVLTVMEHQEYPFYRVVENFGGERDPARSPLFQVVYNWNQSDPQPVERSSFGKLIEGCSTGRNGAPYELTLTITSSENQLTCNWNCNTNLFDASTIEHMAATYLCLLRGAVECPDMKLSTLPLVDETEGRRLLALNDARIRPPPPERCVHELIGSHALAAPEGIAVICETAGISYGELEQRSNGLAQALRDSGAERGRCVGLYCERSLDLVVALLGILKSGSIYVPLERSHPTARLLSIVEDADIRIIVGQPGPLTEAAPLKLVEPGAVASGLSRDGGDAIRPCDLAYNIYTSGSTGKPKGVCVEHGSLAGFMQAMGAAIGITGRDRLLATTTPAFDISLLELLLPLTVGGCVVIAKEKRMRSPDALLREIREQGVSFMQATPAGWQLLLDSKPQARTDLKMLCGGEPLSGRLASRLLAFGDELWNVYGPTETTIWVGALPIRRRRPTGDSFGEPTPAQESASDASELIGAPIENSAWLVLDEGLRLVPIGMPGELCIAGRNVGRGYWRRPDLTAKAFVQSPFDSDRLYRTGDRVRCLADGRLKFLGRKDRQLKVRGFRIEPGEIEAALVAHPSIQTAVAMVRSNRRGQLDLVGYVVVAPGAQIVHQDIRRHLLDRLPDYFIPSLLVELAELPVTVNGKIDYAALPEPSASMHVAISGYVKPESTTERWLCNIWADVLSIEPSRIGIDQNFFELGGHSLVLVRVFNHLADRAPAGMALTDLYRYPTIRGLAERIDGKTVASATSDGVESRADRRKKGLLARGAVKR
jgi:amino acid adenylation domain-containing protein